jgi:hypothetical protein
LAVNQLANAKIIPDNDDLCDHHYRGFPCDDAALIGVSTNINLGFFCLAFLTRPANGRAGQADQACPSNRQDHLPDQNDLYAHDA